jgi:hypothetical protein
MIQPHPVKTTPSMAKDFFVAIAIGVGLALALITWWTT